MKTHVLSLLFIFVSSSSRMTLGFTGEPYSDDGCDSTRGCFACGDRVGSCAVNVAWEPDRDEGVVKFTLWGSKTGDDAHVSMGITTSRSMFNADVYSCISNGTADSLVRSWNPSAGRTTLPRNLTGVYGQEVSVVDSEIRCQFYRYMSLNNNDPEFFDISGNNSDYYLILAAGPANGGTIQGHLSTDRGISPPVILSQVSSAGKLAMSQFGLWILFWTLIAAFHVTK